MSAKKMFNLSEYLEEKRSSIKLGEEEFEISDGFNDLLKIDALSDQKETMTTTDFVKEFLGVALGEETAKMLIGRNYSTKLYIQVMHCIEEVYSGVSESEKEDAKSSEQPSLV